MNRPYILVLSSALLWSTGGLFIKASSLSAFELSFGRSLMAAVTVALLTRHKGFGINPIVILSSLFYAALLFLFVVATKLTTAANAIFLQYTAPIYILILEPLLYKQRYRVGDFLVILFCLSGMSLFFVEELDSTNLLGSLAALSSGLFYLSLKFIQTKEINPASSVIYGNLLLSILMAAFIDAETFNLKNLLIITYLGIFQIGLAYILLTVGIAKGIRLVDASIIGYIEPILNPVWVFLFLGERPSGWAILGGAIIIATVALHTLFSSRTSP
jgi:drug/metabolite transporter, DME family